MFLSLLHFHEEFLLIGVFLLELHDFAFKEFSHALKFFQLLQFSLLRSQRVQLAVHFFDLSLEDAIFCSNVFVNAVLLLCGLLLLLLLRRLLDLADVILKRGHFLDEGALFLKFLLGFGQFVLVLFQSSFQLLILILELEWCQMVSVVETFFAGFALGGLLVEVVALFVVALLLVLELKALIVRSFIFLAVG